MQAGKVDGDRSSSRRATARRSRPRPAGGRRRRPRSRSTPTRRGQQLQGSVYQAVGTSSAIVNLGGRPPLVVPSPQTVQTENLNAISYFVPSMLGLSVMQVGIFAAIPLVADREKLILKRLAATPLRRWQLVGSNVLMRLLIAFTQAIIIVAVGSLLFGVEIIGSLMLVAAFVTLGAMAFLALGYVIASFAKTEDAANGMTSDDPVPDDVPVRRVLPDRPDAAVPAGRRPAHPADLPGRRAPPGHGRRGRLRAVVGLRGGPRSAGWSCCFAIAARKFQWQ